MEKLICWLHRSPDTYRLSVTGGRTRLPAEQFVDRALPSYVDRLSARHGGLDIGSSSTDVQTAVAGNELQIGICDRTSNTGDQIWNKYQSGSSCGLSSPPAEEFHLLTSTESNHIDADSTGVTVSTEALMDYSGDLLEITSNNPTHGHPDITVSDFDGQVQPLGDASLCSVCGDVAAGFHCGAYVCEACKKFFVRCLKQRVTYTCSQNEDCVITKETRTRCARCRFHKCIQLGMYRPGGPNLSSEMCHIPCEVCAAPSSGFHFGAITCEGCKGFFRRSVKERDCLKYQCPRNGSCMITFKTRNVCKACRYNQCLRVGMEPEKSRIGRQPNAVKHATFLQLQRIKCAKGVTSLSDPFTTPETKLNLMEAGGDGATIAAENDPSDFSVTTSHDSRTLTGNQKKPRRPYKRRLEKPTTGVSEGSNPLHCVDSTQLCLSPIEIKEETLSPVDCDTNDLLDQIGVELVQDVSSCREQQCLEQENPPSGIDATNVDSVQCYDYSRLLSLGDFQPSPGDIQASAGDVEAVAGGLSEPRPGPSPTVSQCDSINSAVHAPGLSHTLQPNYEDVVTSMQRAYYDLIPILHRLENMPELTSESTMDELWAAQMISFVHQARATLKFAKKIPGFRTFFLDEQISMVQASMFPIVVAMMSLEYDIERNKFSWFTFTDDERDLILSQFEPFRYLEQALHLMGHVIHRLEPDATELSFLCGLHLIDSGSQHTYKELLLDALDYYIKKKCGTVDGLRRGHILMCLRDLAATNECHKRAIRCLFSSPKFAHLEVPQLYKETFVGIDDDDPQPAEYC